MEQREQQILNRADKLQKECHQLTNELMKNNPKLSYGDCTNVWLFKKLAEIEIRLREIQNPYLTNQ